MWPRSRRRVDGIGRGVFDQCELPPRRRVPISFHGDSRLLADGFFLQSRGLRLSIFTDWISMAASRFFFFTARTVGNFLFNQLDDADAAVRLGRGVKGRVWTE